MRTGECFSYTMVVISCPKSRCTWKSDDLEADLVKWTVELHLETEHEKEKKKE